MEEVIGPSKWWRIKGKRKSRIEKGFSKEVKERTKETDIYK